MASSRYDDGNIDKRHNAEGIVSACFSRRQNSPSGADTPYLIATFLLPHGFCKPSEVNEKDGWPVGIELETIEGKCPLDARQIKMVSPKNLKVPQLIAQAKFVISLQLVSVARPADTLKILATVGIANFQTSNEPGWHDVIHMAPDPSLFEIHSTRLHLALPA
jgi:hypothetical protein